MAKLWQTTNASGFLHINSCGGGVAIQDHNIFGKRLLRLAVSLEDIEAQELLSELVLVLLQLLVLL